MEVETVALGISSVALFGLTGSLHCAAMCGALSASACGLPRGNRRDATQYFLARGLAYSFLGCLAGLMSAMTLARWFGGSGRWLAAGLGASTLVYALLEVRAIRTGRRGRPGAGGWAGGFARIQAGLSSLPFPRPVVLGVTTAILPCGFLAAATLQAALLAHPAHSALAMLAFAAASSPSLFAGGRILAVLGRRWPRATPYLAAGAMAVAGVTMIVRAWHVHHH